MRVGILGGGQLGLMLTHALEKLGANVLSLEADAHAPAHLRLAQTRCASLLDAQALSAFFAEVDVACYETENLPTLHLHPYADKLRPSLHVLQICQNRLLEKNFLSTHAFPTARYEAVAQADSLYEACCKVGFPCILKTATGGYDGKGQMRFENEAALSQTTPLASWPCIVEEALPLCGEISCIVARFPTGECHSFPVFENLHHQHILDFTLLPARFPQNLQNQARQMAMAMAEALGVCGLLTVEFFVTQEASGEQKLRVNELAPRPHNSGHITRKATSFSQFDALAHVLSQTPMPPPALLPGAWCMGNLLGNVWLAQQNRTNTAQQAGPLQLDAWANFPEVLEVYVYGKREAKPQRKMGHFILKADSVAQALSKAAAFRNALCAHTATLQPA
ncbi:MAG: ATP-grasp domain-containing protein [Cystobacterineae bacterium]|nr:ATP-grasp domain-containing protein [Cystobacterineae bacterium]